MKTVSTQAGSRAAMYVRMSTEHQQYSTENQSDVIEKYALAHQMEIVRKFVDYGKSGLTLSGRLALRDLLSQVEAGTADFDVILAYDVSRWGRFQDADESAYYEYVCKRARVVVHYCAEQFDNDGSFSSTLLKTIKRSMAGEYSRELSVKVFAGQCRLIELGYRQGGPAGFGLRRQLVDREGTPKEVLTFGQQKSIQTDRVILIPGPEDEVEIVREMYDLFIHGGRSEREIAGILNGRGVRTDLDRRWATNTVQQVLTNPKYSGSNVYNRRSFKLKKKHVENPVDMWIRCDGAFEPLIAADDFVRAQRIVASRHIRLADDELLSRLRDLLRRAGKLSGILIDEDETLPSAASFSGRFKGLHRAYSLIGYTSNRDFGYIKTNQHVRSEYHRIHQAITAELRLGGAVVEESATTGLLLINQEFTVSLVLARCRETPCGGNRWLIRLDTSLAPDVTVAVRLTPGNDGVLDYYLLPSLDRLSERLSLGTENSFSLDVYRFDNLEFFMGLSRRRTVLEAA